MRPRGRCYDNHNRPESDIGGSPLVHSNTKQISADDVAVYRRATGCSVGQVRPALLGMPEELRARVLEACRTQQASASGLHDPIEDSEEFREAIASARIEAEAKVCSIYGSKRGLGGRIAEEQAKILRDQHHITWFTPRQMNPMIVFD